MRQLAFTRTIIGHARRLSRQVGLALNYPFMLARQLHKPV